MKFCRRCALFALWVSVVASKTFLQRSRTVTPSSRGAASKLGRLFVDLDKSIETAGENAELIFEQFDRYDRDLDASIDREVTLLNKTSSQLSALQARYMLKANKSVVELKNLDAALGRSKGLEKQYKAGLSRAGSRLNQLMRSVQRLIAVIRSPKITRSGKLSQRNQKAIRAILKAHVEFQQRFADVYDAWLTPPSQENVAARFSKDVLSRTADALTEFTASLRKRSAKAFLQMESRGREMVVEEGHAVSRSDAARDAEAERERKVEELAFSIEFTQAVLRTDTAFMGKLRGHSRVKNTLVAAIRDARSSQLTTLYDLIDLVEGRFSTVGDAVATSTKTPAVLSSEEDANVDGVATASSAMDANADADADTGDDEGTPASFLQTKLAEKVAVGDTALGSASLSTGLRSDIDTALRNHSDTHGILLRIQSMLDHAAPIDAGGVENVLSKMGSALRAIDEEGASGEIARRECAEEQSRATQEENRLRQSMKRMSSSRNHTQAAIQAASRNLESIAAKASVLNKTSSTFAKLIDRSAKILNGQRRDRLTIIAAVRKAEVFAPHAIAPTSVHAASALLGQLLTQLQSQEEKEHAFNAEQKALKADFEEYSSLYRGLLDERRAHYADALSALELYESELAGDAASRGEAAEEDAEIREQGRLLCDGVLAFYNRHAERRVDASRALRAVLPKFPDVINHEATDSGAPTETDEE